MSGSVRNISDEVFPGILVGGKTAARNTLYLTKLGVTHVLNTAEGFIRGTVNTNEVYYQPAGITYKGLKLLDVDQTNIAAHFDEVAIFIDSALSGGGKVLVNCQMGMSRSPACVLAYLIIRHDMTMGEAIRQVRKHRLVRPNEGFIRQLSELDFRIRREREKEEGKRRE